MILSGVAIGCGPVLSLTRLEGVLTRVDLGGRRAQILGEGNLYHAPACNFARPAALGEESQAAFLQDERAAGNAAEVGAGLGAGAASAGEAVHGPWEVFLDDVRGDDHNARIDRVGAVDSLRERSDCT